MLILYIFLIPVATVYTICTGKPEPTCGQNASYVDCPNACPATCKSPNEGICNKKCEPKGCRCNPSYLLSKPKGECILPKDCPGGNPCPQNETFVACNIGCPTNYCPVDDSLAILICDPAWPCPAGCFCKQNYKRKSVKDPRCILASECPPLKCTRPNEEWNSCTNSCLRENCYDLKESHISCKPWGCEPRCACKHGFYRNDSRICVPASQCFPEETCDVKPECKRTCAQPNPENCSYETVTENVKGCKCKPGFILSDKDGDCIEIEKCPQQLGCNNDPNAVVTSCPPPCPATCQSPRDAPCKKMCLDVGCRCKNGFILSKLNGLCIKPENCTGGDPCGKNATFSSCSNRCPYNYCPKDDSPTSYDCLPESPCPAGCICKLNHRRKSIVEDRCILASDCPPVNCTRPNEVWSSCPSACLKENCEDAGKKPSVCNTLVLNCQPKCVCKPNTYRDKNKVCVPVDKCPAPPPIKCGVNEEYSKCKIKCPPQFCNNSYTDYGICPNVTKCEPGCNCIKDHLRDFKGNCVLNDNCPPPPTPCGGNATSTDCASACPATCETPKPEFCIDLCKPNVTCQCMPSYVLSPNGNCILPEDCPAPPPPVCSENEVSIICKTRCTSDSCDSGKPKGFCRPGPCRRDCICKEGYARDSNGKCIPKEKCPKIPTPCGANATHTDCASSCPPTCQTPKPGICPAVCKPNVECKCKPSYVLSPKGDCILPKDCPAPCSGNKTFTDCASSCPPTCESPKPGPCAAVCKPNVTCQCKPSYVLSPNGDCILPEDCPARPCGGNATQTDCASSCPPTCESPKPGPCAAVCKPNETCQCKPGYVLSPNGECVLLQDCPAPPTCGGNATLVDCASSCPSTCQTPDPQSCIAKCNSNSCQCKPSYILSKPKGECILPVDCPGGTPCSQNATFSSCNVKCPNSYCPVDDRQGIIICDPPRPCRSGCSCKLNYKLKSIKEPQCILAEECPPVKCTRPNEEWNTCPTSCLKENCEDLKLTNTACKPSRTNCQPRCACKEGFYRNSSRICVPASECFPSKKCDISNKCKATCDEPNPKNCPYQAATENVEGCKCKPGYVLSDKNGECIRIEECPVETGCNGDSNAVITKCPPPCPSTCDSPNETPCKKSCLPVGCKCKDGFILSKLNGLCIKPENCTGGNPCRNGVFSTCTNKCPYNYCPINDSPPDYNCTATSPCRSGCVCRFNHKKKSMTEDQCILASDCPPVNCTRPNEVWDSCPSACLNEGCENAGKKTPICYTLILNCDPRCVCKPNTYRDKNNVCVPVDQCPTPPVVCGENEVETCKFDDDDTELSVCKPKCDCKENYSRDSSGQCVPDTPCPPNTCDVPPECRRTCAKPNPKNCSSQEVSENENGCKCKPGYILLDRHGECVKIEECPSDLGCNGDINALVTQCPPPCPSTCSGPNEILCRKACLDVGCKCKEGFILPELNGRCIPPDECKGGNPCGKNATFSSCSNRCSYNYCPKDDSPPNYNCSLPYRCPSGCVCNLNYRRKSIDDRQCILASECPPVNCTRPNEVWDSCPSDCLQEKCEDAGKPAVPCNTFVLNCQPKCVCKNNTYRNKDKICVPVNKCPKKKPIPCDPTPINYWNT
ncbi:PREDICTED: zonadhesin-like [Papilio polytes]|uniref:zonadhesin-like n=1 Tax=Papilio polytes TaxID=76194 RepID=UPI000675BB95|nr:PREDICTED: zonadhesin-like [Papilio polytes]